MSPENEQLVLAERRGGVLLLTLNRPEKLNAWNDQLEERYLALLADAEDDPDVRAIVVTGAGRGFCSGADMEDLSGAVTGKINTDKPPERGRARTYPLTLRKPLIAAVNGAAIGLGLVEALYCDMRFATPTAKLSTIFARRGLVAEYGISWILARLVGPSTAFDLLLSGRIVTGEEAQRLGLVDRVFPPGELLDAAVAYADELARCSSPWSMATIKAQINGDFDRGFFESFDSAEQLLVQSFRRSDVEEGVRSFMEHRDPQFAGLEPRSRS